MTSTHPKHFKICFSSLLQSHPVLWCKSKTRVIWVQPWFSYCLKKSAMKSFSQTILFRFHHLVLIRTIEHMAQHANDQKCFFSLSRPSTSSLPQTKTKSSQKATHCLGFPLASKHLFWHKYKHPVANASSDPLLLIWHSGDVIPLQQVAI